MDIIYAHRDDYNTPLEEIVRAFSWLIDQGLAHYWGTSMWSATRIEEACEIAAKYRLHAPVVEQPKYNLLDRDIESRYYQLFEYRGYATTIWSPLNYGFLSGKYNEGKIPEDSRVAQWTAGGKESDAWNKFFSPDVVEETQKSL